MDIAWIALGLAVVSLLWQVWTWRQERKFDVRLRIEPEGVGVGKFEVTVVASNHGSTTEAVQSVSLSFRAKDVDILIGMKEEPVKPELSPRRNVRTTSDLADSGFVLAPGPISAYAVLESGKTVFADPFEAERSHIAFAFPSPE